MTRTVHVIFKTHLDVGFTDFAGEVVQRYMESYIPQAIDLARELRQHESPARFIWTTGSWLIYEYLERKGGKERQKMEEAIAAGDIRWHALPFTMHSELLDADLFRFGLSLSQELDERFGHKTIAAKMTDVPGHTRGIVPLMAEAGIEFMHIGVNPASRAPSVPDVFRWHDLASDQEIVLMYHKNNYGQAMTLAGLPHAIAFAHTGDNCGPQSAAQVIAEYEALQARFPEDTVIASTMDAFAAELVKIRSALPVIQGELGDTWIHGAGTDPGKMARYRELLRRRRRWLREGILTAGSPALKAFSRHLLVVPEHTWGLDVKTHLSDYRNYSRLEFEKARGEDAVTKPVPDHLGYTAEFRTATDHQSYGKMEHSWAEQRAYLDAAVAELADTEVGKEAGDDVPRQLHAVRPAMHGMQLLAAGEPFAAGPYRLIIDHTGALVECRHQGDSRSFAGSANPLARVLYQTFSADDYKRWLNEYSVNLDRPSIAKWARPDFSKPGLENSGATSAIWHPELRMLGLRETAAGWQITCDLAMPEEAHEMAGAPETLFIDYLIPAHDQRIDIAVSWFDKPATRLPEALWVAFSPPVDEPEAWRMDKLGSMISPFEVVPDGNRHLHAVGDDGILYEHRGESLRIRTWDAPLVAPGPPLLLRHTNQPPDLTKGWHVNLVNNVWGTNFPMWYGEDARFRFSLEWI